MKYKDWNLTDFLSASPYDWKNTNSKNLTEDEFYDEGFFQEPPSWNSYAEEIRSFLKTAGSANINTIVLYGYQGTGKTTFLHWTLKMNGSFKDYGKMMLDMDSISTMAERANPFSVFDSFFS